MKGFANTTLLHSPRMPSDPAPPSAPQDDPRPASLRQQLDAAMATLRLAQALAESGVSIDLAGLDDQIGRLCAGILDLPRQDGHALRADMILLGLQADALGATLRQASP